MDTRVLYLAWQDPTIDGWFAVGQLTVDSSGHYHFSYTKGAKDSSAFRPFKGMEDLHGCYRSADLFPFFENRLISKNRPEYSQYMQWLGLTGAQRNGVDELAISGGMKATDSYEVFSQPTPIEEGRYRMKFFSHRISLLGEDGIKAISKLKVGENLFVMQDRQNPVDGNAILLRKEDPISVVGYLPRYLAYDATKILEKDIRDVKVIVSQVNLDAPLDLRLLCTLEATWPKGERPFMNDSFKLLCPS